MSRKTEFVSTNGPQSVLVIGCGLIGTSLALALRQAYPDCAIDGVEVFEQHRREAEKKGVFRTVYGDVPIHTGETGSGELKEDVYDLAVVAVPVDAACAILPHLSGIAQWIMDVCSIKRPVCEAAKSAGLQAEFAPSHPMAGLSSAGPDQARGDLFTGRTWICLNHWPACRVVEPVLTALGARVVFLDSAEEHDAAMAAVSHGIHVVSLAAILAYAQAQDEAQAHWALLTGPGFRDVTRLSSSSSSFWISTLLENRDFVIPQIDRVQRELERFKQVLESGDPAQLKDILDESRQERLKWKEHTHDPG